MGMLHIFSHDVHVLLDPKSTLSYVTYYVAVSFGFGLRIFMNPSLSPPLLAILLLLEEFIEIM